MSETRICPTDLHQQIVGPSHAIKPTVHGLLTLLNTGRCPEALGRNRADRSQGILDTMMQFAKDQLLQFIGSFAFLGVDPGLDKQGLRVYPGLFEQQAKAVVLGRQDRLLRGAGRRGNRLHMRSA